MRGQLEIAEGGMTGLSMTGFAIFISVFFSHLIPSWATDGNLLVVGTLMT
jgi:xanthine/uracil/vitamin C permease (AzgA family)